MLYLEVSLWLISLIVAFFIGFWVCSKKIAYTLSTMNDQQLDKLAKQVQELRLERTK